MAMKMDPLYKMISITDIEEEMMAMERDPLYKVIMTTAKQPADDSNEEGSLQRR